MSDGLEVSELKLSEALRDNEDFRIDSEYFKKINLKSLKQIERLDFKYVNNFASVTDGIHESVDYCSNSGINLISATSPRENLFDLSANAQICEEQHMRNPRTALRVGDVVVSSVGTIGNCATVNETILPANSDRHVGIIRISRDFRPHYLSTFLVGKYGRFQTIREATGNVQLNLFIYRIRKLKVPKLSFDFQTRIESAVQDGRRTFEESNALFAEAETFLLSELGFTHWLPTEENVAVKGFSQSFASSGRLDAEYYHPEKQQILDWLTGLRGKSIGDHFTSVYDVLNPVAANPKESVCNYDLDDALPFYLTPKESTPVYELGSTKKRFKQGDVLISRLRSYLREIAVADLPEIENCVGSSEFIVLRPKNAAIPPELLLVYLRSIPVQRILRWCQSGSNHPRFMEQDLLSIKLPDKLLAAQTKIQQAVRKGISVGRESQRLLDAAKRAVEIAIEQNEEAAFKWLEQ